ncbi:MAG: preprotein translocase subunit SecE [Blastochloris viridis]|uniref:Protein translocase subunit SecE n=1 Tax=Blastochloris viridis TaxID=1079 RepID=A0A6N4RCS5_BLAVI|nr:MAG: preprotein translocase subunit SecE [Blastochloris viridis]
MSKASQLIRFGREVRAEISRVTWPSWPETQRLTLMVVLLATLIGIYLALVDTAIGAALAVIFGIKF